MRDQAYIPVGRIVKAVTLALDFAASRSTILLLAGPTGTGKTHAARVAMDWYQPEKGVFIEAFELSRWAPWDDRIEELMECRGIVVVDDLGRESGRDGEFAQRLDGLVSHRHQRGRKSILTTNTELKAFPEHYGARLADRIAGQGPRHAVACEGESLRRNPPPEQSGVWRYPIGPAMRSPADEVDEEILEELRRSGVNPFAPVMGDDRRLELIIGGLDKRWPREAS